MGNASHVRFDPLLSAVADFTRPDDKTLGLAIVDESIHLPPPAPRSPN